MIKILAIDDNKDNLVVLNALCSSAFPNASMITALSGSEGIEKALTENPDVILLDLVMPIMDGIETCKRLKEDNFLKRIPVIMITAYKTDSKTRTKALETGVEAFLLKPIDEAELTAQISSMIRLKKLENQVLVENERLEGEVKLRTKELENELEARKQIEEALRQSEEHFRNLYNDAPVGLYRTTPDGKILLANRAIYEMLGFSNFEELSARNLEESGFEPSYRREQFMEQIEKNGEVKDLEAKWICCNGEVIIVRENAKVICDSNGKPLYYDGTVEDITGRKQAEEQLLRAKDKAEESDRLKSAFLANISHEIRTPLNAIVGFSGLFSDPDLSQEDKERFSEIIKSRSDDLLQIINDIFEISRIVSGNEIVTKEQVVVNDILDEMEVDFRQKLRQSKKTNLQLIGEKKLSVDQSKLITDRHILKRVFSNLIDNAIKFTESGMIRFGYHLPDHHTFTCYVSDTGIGISTKNQEVIFEHFRQAVIENPKKLYGGTGLGLSVCKGSLALLGGKIWVESVPGEGSVFYFTIPFEQPPAQKTKPKRKPDDIQEEAAYNWSGKKLLLLEDEESNMEFLRIIFIPTKAELVCARNGRELRNLLGSLDTFNLVLLDVRLPDANGWELAKEIKAIRSDLPVIAQTAYAMASDRQKSEEVGCDNYISKPIRKEALLEMLAKYLEDK